METILVVLLVLFLLRWWRLGIFSVERLAPGRFANGPNKNPAAGSDVSPRFVPRIGMLQTDHGRAQASRQNIQELPVGVDSLSPDYVSRVEGGDHGSLPTDRWVARKARKRKANSRLHRALAAQDKVF